MTFQSNPKSSELIDFFSPLVVITYYDDNLGSKSKCPKGCISNLQQLQQTIKKIEKEDSKLLKQHYKSDIVYFKGEFTTTVTTKIKEKKLTKDSKVLKIWNLTETLFIKHLKNKLAIVKVDIVINSVQ